MDRFGRAPDAEMALALLRDLAGRPAACGPRKVDRPLVLYGAGNLGKMAREYFGRLGIELRYVVDADPHRYRADPFWRDVEVVGPQDVPAEERGHVLLAVCVATVPYSGVRAALVQDGWSDVVPFYDVAEAYRDRHPLGNGWFAGELGAAEIERIGRVFARWGDDASRAHHLQFMAWHALREDWLFGDAPVEADERYFIPQVRSVLREDEVFVDAGAHHGEASLKFMRIAQGRFRGIWMAEPDRENFSRLGAVLRANHVARDERIHTLICALGEQEGAGKFFEGAGYAAQLSEIGQGTVDVQTIDRLGVAPTFIKLHLEGGELAALKGGLGKIRAHRPLIAATTYHNRLGLWELPDWLMDNLPDYVFLMRLHGWCGTGAVMYCIPCERADDAAGKDGWQGE